MEITALLSAQVELFEHSCPILQAGGVPERPNGTVLKTVERELRGFKSHPLRQFL